MDAGTQLLLIAAAGTVFLVFFLGYRYWT